MPKFFWAIVPCLLALLFVQTATASVSTSIQANDKGWEKHSHDLYRASQATDVGLMDLVVMTSIESTMGKNLKNKSSGAAGLFGMTNRTWKVLIKTYGSKFGIKPGTPRSNARANAILAAEYMKENKAILEASLHRRVGVNEIYMAHLLGPGGAVKLLKANNGRLAYRVIPGASRNKAYFFDKKNRPYTVAEFKRNVAQKINRHRDAYSQKVTLFAFHNELPLSVASL